MYECLKKICMQERMSMREDSGNGRSIIEVEGRLSLPLWLAEKNKWAHVQVSNSREGEEEIRVLLQAIRVLRNSLSSPQTVTSWSSSLKRDRTGSSASSITQNMVERELREATPVWFQRAKQLHKVWLDSSGLYNISPRNTLAPGPTNQEKQTRLLLNCTYTKYRILNVLC